MNEQGGISIKKYCLWILGIICLLMLAFLAFRFIQHREWLEQRRIQLLEDALAPKTADAAAYSWAEAVKTRNGAWQYANMDDQLRKQYLKEFEATNWVTGFSSPTVGEYHVIRESQDDNGGITFKVKFDWCDSKGYLYSNYATLIVGEFNRMEPDRWLLIDLDFNYEPASETGP